MLVQKQLSKGDDIELKSSLTSTNATEEFALSYDADDYYTEIEEIEIIEPDVKIESRSKSIKKGTDQFCIEYFERNRSLSFDPQSIFISEPATFSFAPFKIIIWAFKLYTFTQLDPQDGHGLTSFFKLLVFWGHLRTYPKVR